MSTFSGGDQVYGLVVYLIWKYDLQMGMKYAVYFFAGRGVSLFLVKFFVYALKGKFLPNLFCSNKYPAVLMFVGNATFIVDGVTIGIGEVRKDYGVSQMRRAKKTDKYKICPDKPYKSIEVFHEKYSVLGEKGRSIGDLGLTLTLYKLNKVGDSAISPLKHYLWYGRVSSGSHGKLRRIANPCGFPALGLESVFSDDDSLYLSQMFLVCIDEQKLLAIELTGSRESVCAAEAFHSLRVQLLQYIRVSECIDVDQFIKTPIGAFIDSQPLVEEKFLERHDLRKLLSMSAIDPCAWYVFERLPGFEAWFNDQYTRHRSIHRERVAQLNRAALENMLL